MGHRIQEGLTKNLSMKDSRYSIYPSLVCIDCPALYSHVLQDDVSNGLHLTRREVEVGWDLTLLTFLPTLAPVPQRRT